MADLATLIQRLTDAEAALNTVVTTGQTLEVRVDNDRIAYGPVNVSALRLYIRDLKAQIIAAGGTCADGGKRRRAFRPYIGWSG